MRKFYYLAAALSCFFFNTSILGLDRAFDNINFHVTTWTTEEGLPQDSVNRIIQSRDGYLWMATNGGIARFDGVKFTICDTENIPELRTNRIKTLLETRDGMIWIGTSGGGLTIMNKKRDSAITFSMKNGLVDNFINNLYEDSKARVWILTGRGINYFEAGQIRTFSTADGLSHNVVHAIYEDSANNLWFAASDGVLNRFSQGKFTYFSEKNGIPSSPIEKIYEDKNKNIWFSSASHLIRFKEETFTLAARVDHLIIREDNEGNLWGGSYEEGLFLIKDDRLMKYQKEQLDDKRITALSVDREGTIWLGTASSGLVRLKKIIIKTYSLDQGLPHFLLLSIHQDNNGTIWAGTNGKGIAYLERGSATSTAEGPGINKKGRFKPFPLIDEIYIWSIFTDREGTYWFGAHGSGLYRVKDGVVKNFRKKDGLPRDAVVAIYEDSQGNLWIGTAVEGGPCIYKDGILKPLHKNYGFVGKSAICFLEDSRGAMWIGTTASGLNRWENGTFTNYSTKEGLSNNHVRSLYEDDSGALWIGTYGGGLNRLKNGKFTPITKKNGLYDNVVSTILADDYGFLWMTCNKGVYKARIKDLQEFADGKIKEINCTYYNRADGMLNAECNGGFQPSACKTTDGKFWIPTIRGIAVFDPALAKPNKVPPPVKIEKLIIAGKNMGSPDFIELSPGSKNLEFHYTAMSFLHPDRVKFKYKLAGFEKKWQEVGTRRIAYYNNVSPGNYTFRVIACNNDGLWNNTGDAFSFYQKPFIYQTWWFYLLCGLGAVWLGILLFQLRVAQLKKRERILAEQVEKRTLALRIANETARKGREAAEAANRSKSEFLANMSHEIRTPLNAVIGFNEMMLETDLNDEQLDYMQTAVRSGEALLTLINDILDFSKVESGQLSLENIDFDPEEIAFDVCKIVRPQLGSKPVEIFCRTADNVPPCLNGDPGRFRQVLLNLMSNAVKFTEKGEVELSLSVAKESENTVTLHTIVKDSGIGIPKDKIDTIFDSFLQADGATTREYGGSGLGLAISKQLAKLMAGDIKVESKFGTGSAFHFRAVMKKSAKKVKKWPAPPSLKDNKVLIADEEVIPRHFLIDEAKQAARILLAEDNPVNQKLAKFLLTKAGYFVEVVDNGKKAVETYTADPGEFDMILMDVQMPEMDGIKAARLIREKGFIKIPIIAMTAQALKGDREKCLQAGMNDYISKPIKREAVFAMVKKWTIDRK